MTPAYRADPSRVVDSSNIDPHADRPKYREVALWIVLG